MAQAFGFDEGQQLAQVAPVAVERVGRNLALQPQVVEIGIKLDLHAPLPGSAHRTQGDGKAWQYPRQDFRHVAQEQRA